MSMNDFELAVSAPGVYINGGSIGRALARMRGAGSGVSGVLAEVIDGSSTSLQVQAQSTPDMTVKVKAGECIVGGVFCGLAEDFDTAAMTPPAGDDRIDIVQIDQAGAVTVKAGSEAASPTAPSPDANNLELGQIYHRTTETTIEASDGAGTEGYRSDTREYI